MVIIKKVNCMVAGKGTMHTSTKNAFYLPYYLQRSLSMNYVANGMVNYRAISTKGW
jgi:hypothetical protein